MQVSLASERAGPIARLLAGLLGWLLTLFQLAPALGVGFEWLDATLVAHRVGTAGSGLAYFALVMLGVLLGSLPVVLIASVDWCVPRRG